MKIRRFIGLNKIYFLVELTYQMKEEKTHDSGRIRVSPQVSLRCLW